MHEPGTKRHPIIDMEEFERRLRQSSGNQTEDDPLAELTRLISGQRDLVQRVARPEFDRSAAGSDVARGPRDRGPGAGCASKLRRRQVGLPRLRHAEGHRSRAVSPDWHGRKFAPSLGGRVEHLHAIEHAAEPLPAEYKDLVVKLSSVSTYETDWPG
jgi:hypothetical protein